MKLQSRKTLAAAELNTGLPGRSIMVTQSMLFPWVGLLEQVRLADTVVYYDDVQYSKGSFVNRVQVKTPEGVRWLTIPLQKFRTGQRIEQIRVVDPETWKPKWLQRLRRSISDAPYAADAMDLAESVLAAPETNLRTLARASFMSLVEYFGLDADTEFVDVADLHIGGKGSGRVLDIVLEMHGANYVTGHGAAQYLDHTAFDSAGIDVRYMRYALKPYPQLHGKFTPYVTGLDLVANCGPAGIRNICSETVGWKEFAHG